MSKTVYSALALVVIGTNLTAPVSAEPISTLSQCRTAVVSYCAAHHAGNASACEQAVDYQDACAATFGDERAAVAILDHDERSPFAFLNVLARFLPEEEGNQHGSGGGNPDVGYERPVDDVEPTGFTAGAETN